MRTATLPLWRSETRPLSEPSKRKYFRVMIWLRGRMVMGTDELGGLVSYGQLSGAIVNRVFYRPFRSCGKGVLTVHWDDGAWASVPFPEHRIIPAWLATMTGWPEAERI